MTPGDSAFTALAAAGILAAAAGVGILLLILALLLVCKLTKGDGSSYRRPPGGKP